MDTTSISARINNDIVRWLDSKTKKGKTRSEVLNEILADAKFSDQNSDQNHTQIKQEASNAELLSKGAKASIMLLRMTELALKKHSDHANEIIAKTKAHYQQEMQILVSEADIESVVDV